MGFRGKGLVLVVAFVTPIAGITIATGISPGVSVAARPIGYRVAQPSEITCVAGLRVLTFCSHLKAPYNRYMQRRVFEEAMANKTATLVALADLPPLAAVEGEPREEDTGGVVGCADLMLDPTAPSAASACYVTNVAVHKRKRRSGIARGLMALAEEHVASLGGDELVLHVEESNEAARGLYEALGFSELEDSGRIAFFSGPKFVDEHCPPQRLLCKEIDTALVDAAREAAREHSALTEGAAEGAADNDNADATEAAEGVAWQYDAADLADAVAALDAQEEQLLAQEEQLLADLASSLAPPPESPQQGSRGGAGPAMSAASAAAASAAASESDTALAEVLRVAEEAGRAAAAIVKDKVGADVIKSKASRGDLLTEVDPEVERLIEATVKASFPSHGFLGEESVPAGAKVKRHPRANLLATSQPPRL